MYSDRSEEAVVVVGVRVVVGVDDESKVEGEGSEQVGVEVEMKVGELDA